MILLNDSNDSKYVSHSFDPLYELESRLVTLSASLRTQTGLHCLTIQVLNIKSTSVHSNLEHGLAILTVHSDLSYTTSLVEVQSRSDTVKPLYP